MNRSAGVSPAVCFYPGLHKYKQDAAGAAGPPLFSSEPLCRAEILHHSIGDHCRFLVSRASMKHPRLNTHRAVMISVILLAMPLAGRSQSGVPPKTAPPAKKVVPASPRISLSPRFVPGQTFRYDMEFETTTQTSRTGLASDPEGPSSLVVSWNATVRVEVLAADAATPGGIRLRTTYEKSAASVRSDTFDPAADQTRDQFHSLEGKVIEFTLDPTGKVKYVAGLEGMVDSQKAAQSAREWLGQLSASAGAPPGGVSIGQKWSSEQPADSLPLTGLVWRTASQYLRNEACHPPNPELPVADSTVSAAAPLPSNSAAPADCAVILANLSLERSKFTGRDQTPEDFRKNGVQSAGKWNGSAQSLVYVSLASGLVVSATQTGTQDMDVTMTSNHNTSMRYSGSISTRSQVALVADPPPGDRTPAKP
jgi:hypothetical protein